MYRKNKSRVLTSDTKTKCVKVGYTNRKSVSSVSCSMWSVKVFTRMSARTPSLGRGLGTLASAVKGAIDFNSKHLAKGDPLPPYNGTLRIYNMRFCPFAQRTILALNAKEIEYEVVNVNLMNKPDWLFEKSPFGKVPALEIKEGVTIYESLITVEYLDEVYPGRPLLPKDPVRKAWDRAIVEASGALHNLFFKIVKRPEFINKENVAAFQRSMDFIQAQLQARGTKFLHGNEPGFVDYMIWPWFERLKASADSGAKIELRESSTLPLLQYVDNMMADPAVSQYLVPPDIFEKFHSGYQPDKRPDYELLNKSKPY